MISQAKLDPLGMSDQPGIGGAYPELVTQINKLYSDRVAKIPWIPTGWLQSVIELNGQDGEIIYPMPPYRTDGSVNASIRFPDFLQDDSHKQAWMSLYNEFRAIVIAYAKQDQEAGAAALQALYAKAAFWDAMYRGAVAIRDAPSTAVNAVAGGVKDAIFSNLGNLSGVVWVFVGIAVVGAAVYFRAEIKTALKGAKAVTRAA